MNLSRAINIYDLQRLAKNHLPSMVYDYIEGGCDDECGLVVNEESYRQHRLLPRYLVDVSEPKLGASFGGVPYTLPYGISPTGSAAVARPGIDLMLAAEAAAANVPFILSCVANASIENVMKVAPANTWFQIYGLKDFAVTEDMVRRAIDADVKTLVFSVDVPVSPNRERNRRSGFGLPVRMTPTMISEALTHPRWTTNYVASRGFPLVEGWRKYAGANTSAHDVAVLVSRLFPSGSNTWETLDRLRKLWPHKLLIKGIMHPGDAVQAIKSGADGIIISNHGGRQLDRAPSPLDVLPAIRSAIGSQAELALDGGIRRGSDIVIAMCLGADFVFSGRPTLYGGAAAGRAGVKKALEIFKFELSVVLAQIGCDDVTKLNADYILSPTRAELDGDGGSSPEHEAPHRLASPARHER